MNFYKHHIGDYAAATSHLSIVEDGCYSRLLRIYYRDEQPLPVDVKAVQRLAGARSKDEREAVQTVLEEFFDLEADGWHNKRCDEEIVRANAQAETNREIARAREARKRSTGNARSVERSEHESFNQSSSVREPSQTPDTRQEQEQGSSTLKDSPQPTPAGRACLAMREAGCPTTNPSHPDLLAAIDEGVSAEALADATREAVSLGKARPFAYAIAAARGRHAEGASPIATGPPRNGATAQPSRRVAAIQTLLQGTSDGQRELAERRDSTGTEQARLPVPGRGAVG